MNLRKFAQATLRPKKPDLAIAAKLPSKTPKPVSVVRPEELQLRPPPQVAAPSGASVPSQAQAPVAPQFPALRPEFKPTKIQQEFVNFIEKNKGVGIAAHKAGSGKTAASVMAFLNLKQKGKANKALVVVPAALRANYALKGVKKFSNAKVGIVGNLQERESMPDMDPDQMGDKDFYVISYEMFKKDPRYYLQKFGTDTVIADEMHRMKDPDTKIHQIIENVRPDIQNFIGMTATPAMNDPFEAVSLINAISQKKMSPAEFQKKFYERAASGVKDWFFGLLGHAKSGPVVGFKRKEALGEFVGAKYHFAEPKVPGMPEKKVDVVRVPMGPAQSRVYKAILNKTLTKVERKMLEQGEMLPEATLKKILNKTLAARQISNNAGYPIGELTPGQTPKVVSMMVDATEEIKKNPMAQIIMYSNFVDNGTDVLEAALKEAKIPYGVFTGEESKADRRKAIQDYQKGKLKVLVVSSAGAEGLDLPNTTMIQMMDGHYNPEKIVQAEARGIRRGGLSYLPEGQRAVKVKRYVAVPSDDSMSMDDRVYNIAAKKAEMIKKFKQIVMDWQERQKTAAEFAPGIPFKKKKRRVPKKQDTKWPMVVQGHEARRAGQHLDLRLGDPSSGVGYSWALRKWPAPGQKALAVRQPDHTLDYFQFQGVIPEGYGAGKVKRERLENVEIVSSGKKKIVFNAYPGKRIEEYALINTMGDKWLLFNKTPTKKEDIPQSKPKYKEKKPGAVTFDTPEVMQAKIDGAHCWTAQARIVTDNGTKSIKEISDAPEGIKVLSYDPGEQKFSYKPVVNGYKRMYDGCLIEITLDGNAKSKMRVTPDHRFWQPEGWIKAENIVTGTMLYIQDYEVDGSGNTWPALHKVMVAHADKLPKSQKARTVYNIEVQDNHNYFVSTGSGGTYKVLSLNCTWLLKKNQPIRTFSYRPSQKTPYPIQHTDRIPGQRYTKAPARFDNTVVRGEVVAVRGKDKALPAHELGGMLNANVWKSRDAQKKKHAKLKSYIFDVVKYQGKDFANRPYKDKMEVLQALAHAMPDTFVLPPTAETEKEKLKLFAKIKAGKLPVTKEGIVLWDPESSRAGTKVKFKPEYDVRIKGVFSKEKSQARGEAGGFYYDEVQGVKLDRPARVGTGFSQKLKKDMFEHPEKYENVIAKVEAMEQLPSGALRAPSFQGWHLDKNPSDVIPEIKK